MEGGRRPGDIIRVFRTSSQRKVTDTFTCVQPINHQYIANQINHDFTSETFSNMHPVTPSRWWRSEFRSRNPRLIFILLSSISKTPFCCEHSAPCTSGQLRPEHLKTHMRSSGWMWEKETMFLQLFESVGKHDCVVLHSATMLLDILDTRYTHSLINPYSWTRHQDCVSPSPPAPLLDWSSSGAEGLSPWHVLHDDDPSLKTSKPIKWRTVLRDVLSHTAPERSQTARKYWPTCPWWPFVSLPDTVFLHRREHKNKLLSKPNSSVRTGVDFFSLKKKKGR